MNAAVVLMLGTFVSQPIPRGSIFDVDPLSDSIGLLGLFGVGVLIDREKTLWEGLSPCGGEGRKPTEDELVLYESLRAHEGACDEREVNGLDRFVVGLSSKNARLISDIGLGLLAAFPLMVSAVDMGLGDYEQPGLRFGEDAMVIFQTLGTTLLATNVLKLIARRPRPLAYNNKFGKEERFAGDSRLSFPSGHSSFSFASASITAVMLTERHGASELTFLVGGGAYLLAATVAAMRVVGGKHFVSDVLTGALLGTVIGIGLPLLRRHGGAETAPVATSMTPVAAFTGAW